MKRLFILILCLSPISSFAKANALFVKPYLEIQTALAADSMQGLSEQAAALEKNLKAAKLDAAAALAAPIKSAQTIKTAREQFEKLNAKLVPWFKKHPQEGAELAYCPMKQASWLQKKGAIRNPYYGAEMLECGVKEDER